MKKIPTSLLERELAKRGKYIHYVEYVHKGAWKRSKHLEFLCGKIEQFLKDDLINDKGELTNVFIINMPPQHGKSQAISETLPSWYLGRYQYKRVIEVAYGDDLARRFGRRNKQKIEEFGADLFDIELSKNSRSDTEFELLDSKGSMITRGVMSGITGQPADLIIIDDPIKNKLEALSETYRNRIWEEWLNSIKTRLSANGKVILIMTRWHEDDLAGRLIEAGNERIYHLNIPCEAEDNDPLGRKEGEALFPEIGKDNKWLADFKKSYQSKEGKITWYALYQGRPSPSDGTILNRKWWQYYKVLPELDEMIQSWDCAFKDNKDSDYVVGQVWGRKKQTYYLIDQVRGKLDIVATMNAIKSLSAKYPKARTKLIEDKANGPAVIQMLKQKLHGLIPVNPEGGKIVRAQAVAPAIESLNVYLPDPSIASWVHDFVEECAGFPNSKHDDQVDAMSQGLNKLMSRRVPEIF